MTALEFFPYHNFHIIFRLKNDQELTGVLLDPMNSHETGKSKTIYIYIPTSNMRAWKDAELENNKEQIQQLQFEIDIEDILWAKRLN